jgi:hypothetical protein
LNSGSTVICRISPVTNGYSKTPQLCLFSILHGLLCGRGACAVAPPAVTIDAQVIRLPVTDANDIRFSHLSGSQGLSQRRVTSILQDRQGFMWFGTQYGLNRYDGYRFKVFKHEPDDPHSLSGVSVYALFLDHLGTMWVASGAILDKFDARTETFAHYIIDAEPSPDVANTSGISARTHGVHCGCPRLGGCIASIQPQAMLSDFITTRATR